MRFKELIFKELDGRLVAMPLMDLGVLHDFMEDNEGPVTTAFHGQINTENIDEEINLNIDEDEDEVEEFNGNIDTEEK